jgi:hypothetical protein
MIRARVLGKHRGDGVEPGLDGGGGAGFRRGAGDRGDEQLLQLLRTAEQDFALIREVAEERAFGQAGARCDLGHGRGLVAVLVEQCEGGLDQAARGVGLPAGHGLSVADDTG